MALVTNIVALVRGNFKLFCIKLFYYQRCKYHTLIRIKRNVDVRLDRESSITFGRGVLINSGSVLSATDGGELVLGENVGLNNNTMLFCHQRIEIGDNTIMGPGVFIYDHDHIFDTSSGVKRNDFRSDPVVIGKNCWIGAGVIILKGSIIGDNCLIAAGSVIKGNYSAGSKVVQKRNEIIF